MMEGNSDYSIPSDEEDVKVKVKNDRKMSKESKVQTLSVDFDAILPHIGKNLKNYSVRQMSKHDPLFYTVKDPFIGYGCGPNGWALPTTKWVNEFYAHLSKDMQK